DRRGGGDASVFQRVCGGERFKGFPWGGGARENNGGGWGVFSGGGLDFVIVHLACNAKDDALAWADGVLERNRPRMAIVVTHAYLGPVEAWNRVGAEGPGMGRMCWSKISGGNTPEQMWEKCFSKHEHLFLIVSGDQAPVVALRQVSQGANGNVVHEVMANYPILKDTDDWLRLYRFDVPARKLRALTYSPAQDRLCTGLLYLPWKDAHQFDLDISDAIGRFEARK
ncbi:MAG: hypothetical protein FWH21_04710, partial [Kiritimatiellaeota bacterium]|nr:hypothetical protein [Kiritimatiellota bacterium]